MTVDEMLERLDGEASTGADLSPGQEWCGEVAALIRRWRAGEFTKEEVHDFCHNLSDRVSVEEFAEGCAKYQQKLFGCAPDAEAAFAAERAIMNQSHTEPGSFICRWRERENSRHTPLIASCTPGDCIWVRLQTMRPGVP